jgi:galactofuranosylgalactofuranosylrhamnosyl-N-acetylglucosaminyl-diphospho-decaprenol beta-1,5/1,6-galactofuranosyltransferase
MNIISRIQFPSTIETSNLYLKCDDGASLNINEKETHVKLKKNSVISFNTYFNSFYETFYAKYTKLESLYYSLKLEGSFKVSLYRELYEQGERELIHQQTFENCQTEEFVKISLPDSWRSKEAGRIYIEITCLSEKGLFQEGNIVTDEAPLREVSLGIVSCTFKKEEYIKKTVDAIFNDELLQSKQLKVFIVDNAKTLEQKEFPEENVELIPNRNVGGSGGFTRGLIQAIEEDIYTHFLFMDDDISLESESIYRLFSLYEYASQDFAIAGSMLDLYKRNVLFEAGALYAQCYDGNENLQPHPFAVVPINTKLNLEEDKSINSLIHEKQADYGGFWFFAFSRQIVQEIGLPIPCFIRMDDIEFGLRIKQKAKQQIIAFPGIAVWHEPFYAKNPVWTEYYEIRNKLIVHSSRNSLGYIKAINFLTRMILHKLMVFDYNSAIVSIMGFQHYLKGSNFLKEKEPANLHSEIINLSKTYSTENIAVDSIAEIRASETPNTSKNLRYSFGTRLAGILTLNGHLLPDFLLNKINVLYSITSEYGDWWPKAFRRKRMIVYREGNPSVQQYEMNQLLGISILLKWLFIAVISSVRWSSVSADWRNSFDELTSMEFWKKYLKLDKEVEVKKEGATYASTK